MSTKDTARTIVVLVYSVFMVAVIALAVVATLAQRAIDERLGTDRVTSMAMQREYEELNRLTWALDSDVREHRREDRKSLERIRQSLDHITIRVHVPSCCP